MDGEDDLFDCLGLGGLELKAGDVIGEDEEEPEETNNSKGFAETAEEKLKHEKLDATPPTNPQTVATSSNTAILAASAAAQQAHARGHYAHSGDLLERALVAGAGSAAVRSECWWRLAAAKRSGGHLREALLSAQQAQDEVGAAACSCEAHFEEGAVWQALDCTATAAACFQRALANNPGHGPSVEGAAYCKLADEPSSDVKIGERPGAELTLLLGAASRGTGVVAHPGALPEELAEEVLTVLREAPAASWRLNQRNNTGSAAAAARGVAAANMSYSMYVGDELDSVVPDLRPHLASALRTLPHERLLLNASKYVEGSFLEAHTDSPSGSLSYERVRAFVWHLSKGFTAADGGVFSDEESNELFVPAWNTLVHFEVPRWHSVSTMTTQSSPKERFSIYGWVVVPKVKLVPSEHALQLTLYQHRMVALYVPGPTPVAPTPRSLELLETFGAAAHRPCPSNGSATRGDYIRCCVATEPWAGVQLIPNDVLVAKRPAVLLFVDCALVGYVQPRWCDVLPTITTTPTTTTTSTTTLATTTTTITTPTTTTTVTTATTSTLSIPLIDQEIEDLFNSAWSYLAGVPPVLRGRDSWEDQLCLAAMRFNKLPLLAFVVGRSALPQRMKPEVMRTVRAATDTLKDEVFVYVTTNPQLCSAFGITTKQTPTAVLHGSGGADGSSMKRLLDFSSPSPAFETANVVDFVRHCLGSS